MVHALSARGCQIVEAPDAGSIAPLLTEDVPFDVVVLDYRLPDSQGLGPLATVRRLSPGSRVIMVSAHMLPDAAEDAYALGAIAVLSKPFDLDDLCALIGLPDGSG